MAENDDFSRMMQQVEYDGALNAARTYLDAGEFDKALNEANRAKGMSGIVSTAEANSLVSAIQSAISQHKSDESERKARERLEQEQREERRRLEEQSRNERQRENQKIMSDRSSQQVKLIGVIGKLAFAISILSFVYPIATRGLDGFLWSANAGLCRVLVFVGVILYTFSAYNRETLPTGGIVLPLVWSAVSSFLLAACYVQRVDGSATEVWRLTGRFLVPLVVVVIIARVVGDSARKARNR
jgi:cation transport ATPase